MSHLTRAVKRQRFHPNTKKVMYKRIINLVVLISGGGSNLQSIIDSINKGNLNAKIDTVISDRQDAYGRERARNAGISEIVIIPENYASKSKYEDALAKAVAKCNPDLVALAGFMRILGSKFITQFQGRLINIHPSLLPNYKGLNTHQRVIDAGDKVHGATVHFVTVELDDGPIIIQAQIDVDADDDATTLQQKVLHEEHKIYPQAMQWIAEGKVNFAELDENACPII